LARLEALRARIGDPFEWSSSAKASLLLGITFLLHTQYVLWAHYLLNVPGHEGLVNGDFLRGHLDYFHMLLLTSATLLGFMLLLRRSTGEHRWVEYVATHYYGLSLCYFSFHIGTLSLPTGAVITGAPVVGFILFSHGAVLWALFASLSLLAVLSYASAFGFLPYAPAISGLTENGQLSLFWLSSMFLFTLPHLVVLTALAYYILNRWRRREEEIRTLSMTDPLTGLYNRRSILAHLWYEHERSKRQGPPMAVMMVDLDNFKQINDTWGHPAGDIVLVAAANALRGSLRQNDQVGRFGGEEFLVVLPGADVENAKKLGERCRQAVAELDVDTGDGQVLKITCSIGLACFEQGLSDESEALIKSADQALYNAKETGRDKVVLWT